MPSQDRALFLHIPPILFYENIEWSFHERVLDEIVNSPMRGVSPSQLQSDLYPTRANVIIVLLNLSLNSELFQLVVIIGVQ